MVTSFQFNGKPFLLKADVKIMRLSPTQMLFNCPASLNNIVIQVYLHNRRLLNFLKLAINIF